MSRLFAIVLVLLLSSLLATSTLFAGTRVFADQEATSGSGTSGDPWVGWQNAISSDTEVVFIKGYYEALGNASISLPSNVALIGVDGAIVQWPEERSSIKSIFDIAAGVESVDIMGLQFEAGVSVPIEGLSSDPSRVLWKMKMA